MKNKQNSPPDAFCCNSLIASAWQKLRSLGSKTKTNIPFYITRLFGRTVFNRYFLLRDKKHVIT